MEGEEAASGEDEERKREVGTDPIGGQRGRGGLSFVDDIFGDRRV